MLKTTRLSDNLVSIIFRADSNEIFRNDSSIADKTIKNLSKAKKPKNKKSKNSTYIKAMRKPIFLTSSAKKVFNQLRQAFIKALILQHFNPECYIWIETNISGYAIIKVFNQLSAN